MNCDRAAMRMLLPVLCALALISCSGDETRASEAAAARSLIPGLPAASAPPADSTGGFDGQRAYQHVADLVAIGPRSAGTEAIRRTQQYIFDKLQSFGCLIEQQDFRASTPIGTVEMQNIIAKVPGASQDVVLLATHYDTKRLPNFVGADDGGSSTGVMLEMARLICQRRNAMTVWIAFFDGEEAFGDWSATDSTYGSREVAARLALSGEIGWIKAMLLADIVGGRNLRIKRELNSTPWLSDLVWSTARRLGYESIFVSETTTIEDDHLPFLRRQVPAVDIIDLDVPYWHTPQDTMDKISPRSLAVVGHVLIETLPELERRFGKN